MVVAVMRTSTTTLINLVSPSCWTRRPVRLVTQLSARPITPSGPRIGAMCRVAASEAVGWANSTPRRRVHSTRCHMTLKPLSENWCRSTQSTSVLRRHVMTNPRNRIPTVAYNSAPEPCHRAR